MGNWSRRPQWMGTFIQAETCTYFFTNLLKTTYWVLHDWSVFTKQLMKIEAICSHGVYIPGRRNRADPEKATWCRRCQGINATCEAGRWHEDAFPDLSRDLKTVRGVSRGNHAPGRASPQRPVNRHLCALTDGRSWWQSRAGSGGPEQQRCSESLWGPQHHMGVPSGTTEQRRTWSGILFQINWPGGSQNSLQRGCE